MPDAGLDAYLERLTPVLDVALDAVVVMGSDDLVLGWNRSAEAVFGWTRQEAIGRPMSELIIPEEHRLAHEVGLARFNRSGEARILGRRIEISALHKDGRQFPVELAVTSATAGADVLFIGFLRDISRRREHEHRLKRQALEAQLLFQVTSLSAETDSVEEALRACLAAICQLTGWAAGHALVPGHGSSPEMVSTSVWHEEQAGSTAAIRAATESMRFFPGVGLPGTILRSREPTWISDTGRSDTFLRKGLGFSAAFGFPVMSGGEIIAVLEFFAHEKVEPDPDILLLVRSVGEQVGRVLERKRSEEHQRLMTRELNHRVRNNLAVIQSVARQTFKSPEDREALHDFEQRVAALAAAHDILTGKNWEAASLEELVRKSLFSCGAGDARSRVQGPRVLLPPRIAVAFTMAIHELCTNAVKYGALSAPAGIVEVSWDLADAPEGLRLVLRWSERGGPPVSPPRKRGFGSRMIERALARELHGSVELRFEAGGVRCTIDAPAPVATQPC